MVRKRREAHSKMLIRIIKKFFKEKSVSRAVKKELKQAVVSNASLLHCGV